ncbi:N-acetylneuraminate synthase family protein [uncultured Mailhella sp.]|uniref:N-acetylneuraminate synthase family protein n=1 Tax=uncultured Mailhella sp. TaxID=1981031 RepID=UPI002617E768|nr:N-acetylneuraminate synthase family protein [uncultured Mailhella sp.]
MNVNSIFEDLFVLELANNHWGNLERGLKIIQEHAAVVRYNAVRAAIKLQLRDVDTFIHKSFKGNQTIRYIKKTEATSMARENFFILAKTIRDVGCIPMATPFDEKSVQLCVELDLPIIKIASSDVNDWPLIDAIAHTKRPVIVSSGGSSEKSLDDIVAFCEHRNIPLAINHCVSLYPSENSELELNQIDYLKKRYPGHVIGFSSHEYTDWQASMYLSYAKGARTWERHIDIAANDGHSVSPYCSLPEQIGVWFNAYKTARSMCGGTANAARICSNREITYLDALVRGVYARHDLPAGHTILNSNFGENFYMAIPLCKGQLSCREIMHGERLAKPIKAHEPLLIDHMDGSISKLAVLKTQIEGRGCTEVPDAADL